jgi:hypothetical protein
MPSVLRGPRHGRGRGLRGGAAALATLAALGLLAPATAAAPALPAVPTHPAVPTLPAIPTDCVPDDPRPQCLPPGAGDPIHRSIRYYDDDVRAVPLVEAITDGVLDHVKPVRRLGFRDIALTIHVIPQDTMLTELPGWGFLHDEVPDNPIWDSYDQVRGYARYVGNRVDVFVGAERMADIPGEYPTAPSDQRGQVLAHELGHAVRCRALSSDQRSRLEDLLAAARARHDAGDDDEIVGSGPSSYAYTVSDKGEFFAEATAAWFEWGSERYRQAWLAGHDNPLYGVLAEVYLVPPAIRTCDGRRAMWAMTAGGPFTGTAGPDVVVGTAGADTINGGSGNDVVCGAGGDDVLNGSAGNDRLVGGPGADTLRGSTGNDSLDGGTGNDSHDGGSGNDALVEAQDGESGHDTLQGGTGDDVLFGGTGNDTLTDTAGHDGLLAGEGNDTLTVVDDDTSHDTVDAEDGLDWCSWNVGGPNADSAYGCERWPYWPLPPIGTNPAPPDPPENAPVTP